MIVHRSAAGNVGASQKNGFSVLELLVIVVIVCAIAAIGIPTLHVKAKSSILYANFHSLANLVETDMLERSGSATTGGGNSGVRLADGLEVLLRGQKARQRFVNPCAGRETASVIVNSSSIPRDPSSSPPAVFITDMPSVVTRCLTLSPTS